MIERRTFTQLVLARLQTTGKPVGLANAPQDGGWKGGQPNADGSNFVAYSVLYPVAASYTTGSVRDPQADVHLPYTVGSFGVIPDQAEWMADAARAALAGLVKTTAPLGTATYKIQKVDLELIGALNRYDATDPPFWGQTDQINFWLAKEIA